MRTADSSVALSYICDEPQLEKYVVVGRILLRLRRWLRNPKERHSHVGVSGNLRKFATFWVLSGKAKVDYELLGGYGLRMCWYCGLTCWWLGDDNIADYGWIVNKTFKRLSSGPDEAFYEDSDDTNSWALVNCKEVQGGARRCCWILLKAGLVTPDSDKRCTTSSVVS